MKPATDCEIRRTLAGGFEGIEEFVLDFRARCLRLSERPARFTAELLLREALTNAVQHGCKCDCSKHVDCVVRFRNGRLTIAVADGGEGFDWRSAWVRDVEPVSCAGRGLAIYRKYATRVRFNQSGNAAVIWKRF